MKAQHLLLAGAAFNAAVGVFHLAFWKLFRWRDELPKLHPVNRGVMQVLNLMLAYGFFAVAFLQAWQTEACLATPLGRAGTAAAGGFWLVRAALQPVFWRHSAANRVAVALGLAGAAVHFAALAG